MVPGRRHPGLEHRSQTPWTFIYRLPSPEAIHGLQVHPGWTSFLRRFCLVSGILASFLTRFLLVSYSFLTRFLLVSYSFLTRFWS